MPSPLLLALLAGATAAAAAAAAVAGDGCRSGCPLALAAYYFSDALHLPQGLNITLVASLFGIADYHEVLPYNPAVAANPDYIVDGQRVNLFFPCSCLSLPASPASTYLAGSFPYKASHGETYDNVSANFANLTTAAWLRATNAYPPNDIPYDGTVNVTVNCSCGDRKVSPEYGLFLTYPLWDGETLASVAALYNFSSPKQMELLRKYNPGMDGASGKGIVFLPVKDPDGSYHPLKSGHVKLTHVQLRGTGNGVSIGATAGIVVGSVAVLTLGIWLFVMFYRRRKEKEAVLHASSEESVQLGGMSSMHKASPDAGITVDKSVEFSCEELFSATQGFSMANKIGQGGFGSVYYAELRGEKAAIKKMDMKATQEFLAELKVLTNVHHLNLVRLIGYCIESCLFLVYEFIENGNLSQHLRGAGYEPLSWATRVQIALDSARGLEYIHEHTVPVYIHRDIKSANILIDKDFRAKVADFGLAKLTEIRSISLPTSVVGTFGYMPPEYARYGDVSPKVDVYAFGVVLYELISAKEAIVRSTDCTSDTKGLVYLFEEAFNTPDPKEALHDLIDSRLQEDYPIDSILKMSHLARACTHGEPKMRPTMRSVVVALMTLSSPTEFWDKSPLCENQALANRVSGR